MMRKPCLVDMRASACAVGLAVMLLAACSAPPPERTLHGETMGTTWSLKLVKAVPDELLETISTEVTRLLDAVNAGMSTYREDSELNRFNRSRTTQWQPVSPELAEVVAHAQRISEMTSGAFDVTVAPVVELWGFGTKEKPAAFPQRAQLDGLLAAVGYRYLSVRKDPPALRKSLPDVVVDLSAIAKGYAADKLAELVEAHAIVNYLAEVGGELRASGVNQDLEPWRIGVEKPTPGWRETMRAVHLSGQGIATSGDYRNFIEIEGVRYSHEIDPRTGEPVRYRGASVTVIAATAAEADAWATGLFVLGKERALPLAKQHGLAVYFIEQTGDGFVQTMNSAFADYLVLQQ